MQNVSLFVMSRENRNKTSAFQLKNKVIHGDCLEIMRQLPAESVGMIFADPPYNLSKNGLKWLNKGEGGDWHMMDKGWDRIAPEAFEQFSRQWVSEGVRTLRPGGSMWICATLHNLETSLTAMRLAGLRILNLIVWNKPNAMPNMTRRVFTHSCEYLVWGVKGGGWTFNYDALKTHNPDKRIEDGLPRQMRDMWSIPVCQGKERIRDPKTNRAAHPTQKPVELPLRAILGTSTKSDIVLDPFGGSGTTAVAAARTGRPWILIEKDPDYVRIAIARIKSEVRGSLR